MSIVDDNLIEKCLQDMTGSIRLPVSKFSAKKIQGRRSYNIARKDGRSPAILQDMDVHAAHILGHAPNGDQYRYNISFVVSSGTYIRSLAEEPGRRLALPATLKNLRRTMIGKFAVSNAQKIKL